MNLQIISWCHLGTSAKYFPPTNTDLISELMIETLEPINVSQQFHTSDSCVIRSNIFETDFLFASSPVLLVLLLPNVGTRLHEATSPSLVVRQTLVQHCNHMDTYLIFLSK